MSLLELKNITFGYEADEPPVLSHLSLRVEQGNCVALTGANGAGKSTVLRLLSGLSFPQAGQYFFDGQEITAALLKDRQAAKRFHQRVGYLLQNYDLMLFNASVYDELAFGPRQLGLTDAEIEQRVSDCLRLFELEKMAGKASYHLSGGQKKRVALAAVLSLNPEVLLLDEPYAGLDIGMQEKLTKLLQELKAAGKTILLVTHDGKATAKLADQVLQL